MASLEHLGLRDDQVEKSALVQAGYAVAVRTEMERHTEDPGRLQEMQFVAASCIARAASLFAFSRPFIARRLFVVATRWYQELEMPYAGVLATCADDLGAVTSSWSQVLEQRRLPTTWQNVIPRLIVAGRMVVESYGHRDAAAHIIAEAEAVGGALVGNALLPARAYSELAQAIVERQRVPLRRGLNLFAGYASRLETAMVDRFHWHRLAATLLPVEPEILGSALVAVRVFGREAFENGSQLERLPLRVAAEILDADRPTEVEQGLVRSSRALSFLITTNPEPEPMTSERREDG